MTEEQNTKKQPSPKLTKLLIDIKITIEKLKELYKIVDKKTLEEGFSTDEIYDIANNDIDIATITTTKQHIQIKNNNNNNNISYPHFQ
jgi:hypothetical protein